MRDSLKKGGEVLSRHSLQSFFGVEKSSRVSSFAPGGARLPPLSSLQIPRKKSLALPECHTERKGLTIPKKGLSQ